MIENYQPLESFTIKDLDTLRVVADPLRNQILEILITGPQTVAQVADKLGLTASKLYYHINLLEKHGVIQVFETRQVGNLIEKIYAATASQLDVEKSLLTFETFDGKESIYAIMQTTLDTTREDLIRSIQARRFELEQGASEHPRQVILNRTLSNLTESKVQELQERVSALIEEFSTADQKTETAETQLYALTVAYYPTFYYPGENKV
jgi:DNA-binding transcriptional ArsR family regulator